MNIWTQAFFPRTFPQRAVSTVFVLPLVLKRQSPQFPRKNQRRRRFLSLFELFSRLPFFAGDLLLSASLRVSIGRRKKGSKLVTYKRQGGHASGIWQVEVSSGQERRETSLPICFCITDIFKCPSQMYQLFLILDGNTIDTRCQWSSWLIPSFDSEQIWTRLTPICLAENACYRVDLRIAFKNMRMSLRKSSVPWEASRRVDWRKSIWVWSCPTLHIVSKGKLDAGWPRTKRGWKIPRPELTN